MSSTTKAFIVYSRADGEISAFPASSETEVCDKAAKEEILKIKGDLSKGWARAGASNDHSAIEIASPVILDGRHRKELQARDARRRPRDLRVVRAA